MENEIQWASLLNRSNCVHLYLPEHLPETQLKHVDYFMYHLSMKDPILQNEPPPFSSVFNHSPPSV